ncbi:MAG TPA: CDP-diacylglycerol--serine O-phosphatidyltransferase [Syntrophobacteria bacterium]|nr:CDP-diacylglycerol--serine O-phosphatidyltransferase [Syntrophobacteria bacterium]
MLLRERQQRRTARKPPELKRGIYILPNLFTTGNLFCGFFAIAAAVNFKFKTAAVSILVSCVFDILDGKVARLTNSQSRFGVEYDSLADLVAFGVAPAVLLYLWALQPFGRLGWVAAFLFVACGALRLARFNVQVNSVPKKHFVGLPIPGAACMVATTVLFLHDVAEGGAIRHFVLLAMTYLLGFLMVSTIPYNSFKEASRLQRMPFRALFLAVLLLSVVAAQPAVMLFTLMALYVVSGPTEYLWKLASRRSQLPEEKLREQGAEE